MSKFASCSMLPTFEPLSGVRSPSLLSSGLSCHWLTEKPATFPLPPHHTVGFLISLHSALPKAGEEAQQWQRVATLKANMYVIYWIIFNQIGFYFVCEKCFCHWPKLKFREKVYGK